MAKKLKVNEDGALIDPETGEPLEGDDAVEIEGLADIIKRAKAQPGLLKDLQKERAKKGGESSNATELQAQLDKVTRELDEAEGKIVKLAADAKDVEKHKRDLDKATARIEKLDRLREAEAFENVAIKEAMKAGFDDPEDAVLRLEKIKKRVNRKGEDGKDTDHFDLIFPMEVTDEDGKKSLQELTIEQAVAQIAAKRPTFVGANPAGGTKRGVQTQRGPAGSPAEMIRQINELETAGKQAEARALKNKFQDMQRGVGTLAQVV